MVKTAIYPGSFDPITLGHLNIIKRAAVCFDRLIVCVMVNSEKVNSGLFRPEERAELLGLIDGYLRTHSVPEGGVEHWEYVLMAYRADEE